MIVYYPIIITQDKTLCDSLEDLKTFLEVFYRKPEELIEYSTDILAKKSILKNIKGVKFIFDKAYYIVKLRISFTEDKNYISYIEVLDYFLYTEINLYKRGLIRNGE